MSASGSYPCLAGDKGGLSYPLSGRVITIGGSSSCKIQLKQRGMAPIVAHLLFAQGCFEIQALDSSVAVEVNGKKISSPCPLSHADTVRIGTERFRFLEHPASEITPRAESHASLTDLISIAVSLLREKQENVFADLVASVSRLLRSDATRLVFEDTQGSRTTLARYPHATGLDRFSDRAIDWARQASRTVLAHDADWAESMTSQMSLEKNLVASILCAPLKDEGGILGYLYLDRLETSPPFTEEDREFCDSLLPLFSEILANYQARTRQRETIAALQDQNLASGTGMVFESETMTSTVSMASRLAATDSPVLILGETGTGKELMARFVHQNSRRVDKPFRAINCGAIPENLIESELFGHEKGAFTGASQRKVGLFEASEGGTVFLDEIGELALSLQVKLLRVLQEGEITRIGGNDTIQIDVRIVAATNRDLEDEIRQGRFRQDLYFRLNVLTLTLPPLRQRDRDIALLGDYFVKKYCAQFGLPEKTLSSGARNALCAYPFPGNIRELENIIQKAILLSARPHISAEDLQFPASHSVSSNGGGFITLKEARAEAERNVIQSTLRRTNGNVSLASKQLDVDRKWLMKLMTELGIDADRFRG